MNIRGAFRFHNIGQGLFYSGLLNKKDANKQGVFSFVYDCGTLSSMSFLKREIDDFKLLLPKARNSQNKKLDLLVVSHLHDDHVNGLEYLLKDLRVDTVVMPYVSEGMKLLSRLESGNDDKFLETFYLDPVAWFVSKGVHRILLLGTEESAFDEKSDISENKRYIEDRHIYVDRDSVLYIENRDDTEIAYLKNESKIKYNEYHWLFEFENLKLDSKKINSFVSIVEEFRQKKCVTLEQIFKSKSLTSELRKKLNASFSGGNAVNRTSVVLRHRPIGAGIYILGQLPYRASCYINEICSHTLCDTILTGDVILKDGESLEILDGNLPDQSKNHLVIQCPHHGSDKNRIIYFDRALVTVLSYGILNRYGHPHSKVLQRLCHPVHVNERRAFDYQILVGDEEN